MSTWKKALSGITIGWMLGATMVVGLGTATAGGGCATDPRNDPFDISDTWNDTGTDSDDRWTSNGAQDTLNSQPCPDRNVDGGGENDEIHLGSQGDYGAGNAGRDEVFGGAGNDEVHGGNGDDDITDTEGDDQDLLYGHADNDHIDDQDGGGGFNVDVLDGGPDSDTCVRDSIDVLTSCS